MKNDNDSKVSLAQALQDMKTEQGENFDLAKVNRKQMFHSFIEYDHRIYAFLPVNNPFWLYNACLFYGLGGFRQQFPYDAVSCFCYWATFFFLPAGFFAGAESEKVCESSCCLKSCEYEYLHDYTFELFLRIVVGAITAQAKVAFWIFLHRLNPVGPAS